MKKLGKVILVLAIILMIATIGFGGWYFFNREKKLNEKIVNLENEIVELKKEDNSANNITAENKKTFTKEDLKIKSFYLGESVKGVYSALDSENIVTENLGIEEATEKTIYTYDFKDYSIKIWNAFENTDDSDGSMNRINLYGNSKLETARGIKIGSTKEDVLKAYPSECILKSEELDANKIISVGVPGSDPVFGSSEIGTIYFEIENGKVVNITLAYAVAE